MGIDKDSSNSGLNCIISLGPCGREGGRAGDTLLVPQAHLTHGSVTHIFLKCPPQNASIAQYFLQAIGYWLHYSP